jgi:hypothetical protein
VVGASRGLAGVDLGRELAQNATISRATASDGGAAAAGATDAVAASIGRRKKRPRKRFRGVGASRGLAGVDLGRELAQNATISRATA